MKKYLMISLVAIAFASCSNNDFYDSSRSHVQDAYDAAFRKYVGVSINPNQDWGFGTAASAPTFDFTRALPTNSETFRDTNPVTKPTMPTSYSNTLPADAKYAKDYQNYQHGWILYIDNEYNTLNNPQNFTDLVIYADGTDVSYGGDTNQNGNGTVFVVTQDSKLTLTKVQNNLTVYLAPKATLVLPDGVTFQKSHAAIYLNAGSKVEAAGLTLVEGATILNEGGSVEATSLTMNSATLWNAGYVDVTGQLATINTAAFIINEEGKTIKAGSLLLNNQNDLLYNNGTVKINGSVTLKNTSAEIVNNNQFECGSLTMDAGSKFHNVGTAEMSGKTYVYNTNSRWVNDGQYTCGEFELDGGTGNAFVFNNCKLTVNGNFHQNHGVFVLDGGDTTGASVVCNSFTWDHDGYFYMGSKSLLKVTGKLLARNYNSGGYGFHGEGSDYAVIQAGSIEKESEGKYRAAYFGKLYIDTNNHFEQGQASDGPWYYYDSSVKFSFTDPNDAKVVASTAPVSIPSSVCNPGYNDDVPKPDIRIIAEDLSASEATDFDFNDVVFDVTFTSETTATITLRAAGGTLPLMVAGVEVHEKFGNYPVTTMINTNAQKYATNGYGAKDKVPAVSFDISGINRSENGKDIKIEVLKKNDKGEDEWFEITAVQGEPAAKLGVDPKFQWVDEKVSLKSVYNQFTDWVAHPEVTWY